MKVGDWVRLPSWPGWRATQILDIYLIDGVQCLLLNTDNSKTAWFCSAGFEVLPEKHNINLT